MPLLARMVASPLTIDVRSRALEDLHGLLSDQRISPDGHVAVVVGPGKGAEVLDVLGPALANGSVHHARAGTIAAARELADELRHGWYDAVVGIGGGRTLDVAKYAASIAGLPAVAVATCLSHDGLASPVASLEHEGRKLSFGVQMPIAVVVDLTYVRRCQRAQLAAGVGDALSNLNALADWELSARATGEPVDGLAVALARSGAESLLHRTDDLLSEDFLTTLAHALVLGGLAMAVAGSSRPCSGACHAIAHALDAHVPGSRRHGDEVAIGALFASWLRADPLLDTLAASLARHGVPRVPADVGVSEDDFAAAVARAPLMRPNRYTILHHLDLQEEEIRERVHVFAETFDH